MPDKLIVSVSNNDEILDVNYGRTIIKINRKRIIIDILSTSSKYKYRLKGIAGSLDLNQEECDFVYSEFKRYN